MSLPENYVTVNHYNCSPVEESRKYSSLPTSSRLSESKKERNVEDFLKKIVPSSNSLNEVENNSNSDSITLKETSRHSSLLLGNESEIPIDLEEENKCPSNNIKDDEIQKIENYEQQDLNSKSPITRMMNEHSIKLPNNSVVSSIESIDIQSANDHEKIATPTIKLTKNPNHYCNGSTENLDDKIAQKSPDYQEFTLKLTEMSSLLQQKDDEIKKLSQKLIEIETKHKSRKKSSSSSSSGESHKSLKEKSKPKNKKEKLKPQDKIDIKKKSSKNDKEKKLSKSNEDKEKILNEVLLLNQIEVPNKISLEQENQSNLDTKDNLNTSTFNLTDDVNYNPKSCDNFNIDKDKLDPDLKQKLDKLESEVRRLQQANVDSILTLQKLQDNNVTSNHLSNDTVINQLLVDHNLLKEELQQLKWEHSKLAQLGLLAEEIYHLKRDMKFMKNFTKKSSKSLNHLASTSCYGRDFKDVIESGLNDRHCFVSNISDSNNSSNYIYQKLQNHRKPISETPSMHNMIKQSIESLESPYHITCQNIQHSTPFSGGPTYRTRKVSDSSSALVEDIKPKSWVESVSKNYKSSNLQLFSHDLQFPSNDCHQKDFDAQSVESYKSFTTSVTEKSEDEWQSTNTKYNNNNGDFLSTQESESTEDTTVKNTENYSYHPRYKYSFTPKNPSDLHLEDLVKFVRPGGKMATGKVCFIGHLPGRSEVCVGLELGEEAGKHDGLFEGHRYFQCRKNRGVFISFHKIILAYKSI